MAVGALVDAKIFTRYSTKEAMDRPTATGTRVRTRALSRAACGSIGEVEGLEDGAGVAATGPWAAMNAVEPWTAVPRVLLEVEGEWVELGGGLPMRAMGDIVLSTMDQPLGWHSLRTLVA